MSKYPVQRVTLKQSKLAMRGDVVFMKSAGHHYEVLHLITGKEYLVQRATWLRRSALVFLRVWRGAD